MSTSLWKDREQTYPLSPLTPAAHYDTVVVGAGFTGLITALLLSREGQRTLVLESRDVGAGASGATTAKATVLQSNKLTQLKKTFDKDLAAAYLRGHQQGLDWLVQFSQENGVPFDRESAWTYASTEKGVGDVEKEHELARELGLPTILHDTIAAPFAVHRAVELPDQMQLNPVDLLEALTRALADAGGEISDNSRVITIGKDNTDDRIAVETARGVVTAEQVVLATASPILDKGKTSAELSPQRSYLCSFEYEATVPDGMLVSVESPTRSLRTAEVDGTRYLLVGGNGHRTGAPESTQAQLDEIVEWTGQHFPGARLTHSWSAQDYHPVSMIPMVKTLSWGEGRVHFAGGYSKWGLTGAPTSARQVADIVLGRPDPKPFGSPSAFGRIKGAAKTLSDMPGAAAKAAADAMSTDLSSSDSHVRTSDTSVHASVRDPEVQPSTDGPVVKPNVGDPEDARTGHEGKTPVGEAVVDGLTCRVSLTCPHMGATLAWNDSERSWDCPLHGSRFQADGTLIEGPATTDLDRL